MKKILLFVAATMMVTSASAQLQRSVSKSKPVRPQQELIKPEALKQEMHMRTPGTPVVKAPKKANNVEAWYRRPAGAFWAQVVVEDGKSSGMYYAPYLALKPYCDYTFNGFADGQSADSWFEWDVQRWTWNEDYTDQSRQFETLTGQDITVQYSFETDSMPYMYVMNPDNSFTMYVPDGHEMSGSSASPIAGTQHISWIMSIPSSMDTWEVDILKSAKNFCYGGRKADKRYPMTYYTGAEPYGDQETGFWFGKNGYHQMEDATYYIDGIAQAFEKPEHPYLLNQIVLDCTELEVLAQVDMTCKVYKLDEIPAYIDGDPAVLPDEPGELIAMGRATLTPETDQTTGGLVFFTLYGEEDGLVYDITPTIDCAILVVIDGYNDPSMANLANFSALISSDYDVDEGFGEMAYLKFGRPDEDGDVSYAWLGLNNFFSGASEMKTAFTIFLSTEMPFLTYNYTLEDGEYTFPNAGGVLSKTFGTTVVEGIQFYSYVPSAEDGWFVSCNDEEVPAWLNIELTDGVDDDGEFSGLVTAAVEAEPLPAGVSYREAVVRFEFPGAYLDYTFKQGEKPQGNPYDVNGDGEVNVADVNALIDMILSGNNFFDVNGDGEMNVADVNALIDYILNK